MQSVPGLLIGTAAMGIPIFEISTASKVEENKTAQLYIYLGTAM